MKELLENIADDSLVPIRLLLEFFHLEREKYISKGGNMPTVIEQLASIIGLPLDIECVDDNTCHTTTTRFMLDAIADSIDTWDMEDFGTLLDLVEAEEERRMIEEEI